jgi:hypothetical protein
MERHDSEFSRHRAFREATQASRPLFGRLLLVNNGEKENASCECPERQHSPLRFMRRPAMQIVSPQG